jgi:hypothetical protein
MNELSDVERNRMAHSIKLWEILSAIRHQKPVAFAVQ